MNVIRTSLPAFRVSRLTVMRAYSTAKPDLSNSHVVGGFKATLNNPNASDEAKAHAREMLQGANITVDSPKSASSSTKGAPSGGDEHSNRVLGGQKATLSNPNTSSEAKQHAKQVLEGSNSSATSSTGATGGQTQGDEHSHRVLGGYKATLSNPNTSEEAKQHAREMLAQAGEGTEANK